MSSSAASISMIIASVLLSSAGQTLLKLGLNRGGAGSAGGPAQFLITAFSSWQVWLGLVLFAASVVVWMRVLAVSDLSWGYPLLGLSYIFVTLAGWLVFGEQLTTLRVAGIAFVLVGAVLIGRS